jgi:hypothetical protein
MIPLRSNSLRKPDLFTSSVGSTRPPICSSSFALVPTCVRCYPYRSSHCSSPVHPHRPLHCSLPPQAGIQGGGWLGNSLTYVVQGSVVIFLRLPIVYIFSGRSLYSLQLSSLYFNGIASSWTVPTLHSVGVALLALAPTFH